MDQSATRPAGLYVVGIGSMLFGLLGMCTQGFTIISTAQQREMMAPPSFPEDETLMQLTELQASTFVPNMVSASLGALVALALLVFGALTIARSGIARWTPAVLIAAVVVELLQLALSLYFQMQMADVMSGMTGRFDAVAGGGMGIGGMTSAAMGAGMCLLGAWAVGKCGFFGASAGYLRKPEIRQLFENPPQLSARGD